MSLPVFWYGIAGAVAIVLSIGLLFGWLLRRSHERLEERYERAMLAAEAGFWDWNVAADEFYISPKLLEMSYHPPGTTFAGRSDWVKQTPIHPDDLSKWEHAVRELFASGNTRLAMEVRTVRDGETRWVSLSGLCVRDAGGKIVRWTGSATDVTARKRAEMALRQSEERYARVMQASDDGFWEWIVASDEFYASPRMLSIYGVPADTVFRGRADFFSRFPLQEEDVESWRKAVTAHVAGQSARVDIEVRARIQGKTRWIHLTAICVRDASGAEERWTGSVSDVTEHRRAEEALRRSEERYARAMEGSDAGHWDWNIVSDEMFISERAREMLALPAGALPETRAEIMAQAPMHPDDRAAMNQKVNASIRTGNHERDYRVIVRPGQVRWLRSRGKVYRDAHGAAVRMTGSLTDITERKLADAALRSSEERFALAVAGSNDGLWDWDILTDEMFLSERAQRIYGLEPGRSIRPRAEWRALVKIHPDDAAGQLRDAEDYLAGRTADYEGEWRVLHPDGRYCWIRIRGICLRDAEGRPTRFAGSVSDIDVRRRAEEALRRSESYLTEALRLGRAGSFAYDARAHRQVHWSPTTYEIFDFDPARGLPAQEEVWRRIHPEDVERVKDARQRAMSGKTDYNAHYRILRRDGAVRHAHATGHPVLDANGEVVQLVGVVTDVTERKRAEEELRDSEARFRALTELSSDWYWRQDEELRFIYISHQVADDRYPLEWVIGKKRWELRAVSPLTSTWEEHAALLAAHQPFRDFEYLRIADDGRKEYVSISGAPIFDERGVFRGYQGIGRNISQRRHAEEELKAMEHKLRQSQRLEAMGTLAGGIAHDFNNILGAILGYGEMAMRDAGKGTRLWRDLDSIMVAGERGRALVDRVLAFSRSSVGERVPVHVEEVVREALDLVSAKLPPDITLHAKLHAARAAMQGDATQVHQVLMNLATNAIQAMTRGGTLRVSLRAERIERMRAPTIGAIAPGDYLVLQVADSGTGIPAEILDRIFDPFFTTKEVGTGTGLGLSLVHGIVTELGGAIDVASTVGAGTTFTVYLPRAGDVAEADADEKVALPRGDGQRVLVVDDEEPLVKLATRTLEELGYAPVGFTSSSAALAAFRAEPQRFDAVITDERMPGLSGSALIREVRGIRDRIPVVLMSGYIGGPTASRAREAGAEEVLKKPLSARELATSLARVLHS